MLRILATLAAAIVAVWSLTGTPADADRARPDKLTPTRVPCAYEDGGPALPCYWDAGKRGNHRGASYWIDKRGTAHYVDGRIIAIR